MIIAGGGFGLSALYRFGRRGGGGGGGPRGGRGGGGGRRPGPGIPRHGRPAHGRRPFGPRFIQPMVYPATTEVYFVPQQPFCVNRFEVAGIEHCSGTWVYRDSNTMCCVP